MHKILIIGCGDIALRFARLMDARYRMFGLVRKPEYSTKLRKSGITPIPGDLDHPHSLLRLAGLADTVIHLAPPPAAERTQGSTAQAAHDTRTRNLLAVLSRSKKPQRLVYISTSGVYGDCRGEVVTEHRPLHPQNQRAKLRVDAEKQIRKWAQRNRVRASILRVPGIYAAERLPLDRLQKGTPAIVATEDGYTNHIHADDLAHIIVAALQHGKPNRVYHTVDDSGLKMGDYFDEVADAFALPHPPRITRAEAQTVLSPVLLSFMNESRRLSNTRMKNELQIKLRYPTVADTLQAIKPKKKSKPASHETTAQAAQLEMFPPPGASPRS